MKFSIAAVVALGAAPVYSFSYLESLSGGSPMTSSSVDIAPPVPAHPSESTDAPFFFTNGAQDEPADTPAFFFTNGASESSAPPTTGSYLENLGGGSAPAGQATGAASGATYLGALGSGATSVSGPGMTGYLDALPHNSGVVGGPGISSYAASLNQAAAEYVAAAAPPSPPQSQPAAPAAPVESSAGVSGSSAPTSGSYLAALSSGSSIGGPGMAGYLDALPRSSVLSGGAGISTYASNIVTSSVAGGPGVATYTDALSGPSSFAKSYAPSGNFSPASGAASSFAMGSTSGQFDFTLEADAETIELLKANAGRRVTMTGRISSW